MIVVTLTDCPPRLRGDLSKWLFEINTGVYVGNLSARVRDALWERICENVKSGRATMVYSSDGEQHMDFRVHNTSWTPIDCDGLKLMRRPAPAGALEENRTSLKAGYSNAAKYQKARSAMHSEKKNEDYTVIDVETSGLDNNRDIIIEIGALRVRGSEPSAELSVLINGGVELTESICKLTGISDELLRREGVPLAEGLRLLYDFIDSDTLICHNARFDIGFLIKAFTSCDMPMFTNRCIDTMELSKRKLKTASSHRLSSIAESFGLETDGAHRALKDCMLTHGIYVKLKEM